MHNFQTVGCTVGDHRKMGENVGESLDLGRREKIERETFRIKTIRMFNLLDRVLHSSSSIDCERLSLVNC